MTSSCLICETSDAKLVCDHNHNTNMIRGTLCECCNSWVAIYERNKKRDRQLGGRRFGIWVEQYRDKIEEHILRDTGVPYYNERGLWRNQPGKLGSC